MKTNKRKSVGQLYTNKSRPKVIQTEKKVQKIDLADTKKLVTPQRSQSVGKIVTVPISTKAKSKPKVQDIKDIPVENKQKILLPGKVQDSRMKKGGIKTVSVPKKSVSIQTNDFLPEFQPTPEPEAPKKQILQKKYTSSNIVNTVSKNLYKNVRSQFNRTAKIYTNTNTKLNYTSAFKKFDDSRDRKIQTIITENKYKKPVLSIADEVFEKQTQNFNSTVKKPIEKGLKDKTQEFLNTNTNTDTNTNEKIQIVQVQKKIEKPSLQQRNEKNEKNEKRKQNINKLEEKYKKNLQKYETTKKTLEELKFLCSNDNKENI